MRQHHNSYLGDADVGADTNVGAGTITANYDGVRKHRTEIGERRLPGRRHDAARAGHARRRRKTGAGAVVTQDVPPGKLAVGVPARIREPRPIRVPARTPRRPSRAPAGPHPGRGSRLMGSRCIEIGIIVLLVLLNAVFVAAEIALVSLRRSRVDQLVDEGRRGAAASGA